MEESSDTTQPKRKQQQSTGDMLTGFIIYQFVLWNKKKSVRHKNARETETEKFVSVILLPIIRSSQKHQHQRSNIKFSIAKHSRIGYQKRNQNQATRGWQTWSIFSAGRSKLPVFFLSILFYYLSRGHLLDVFLLLINNGKNSYYYTLEYMKQRLSEWKKKGSRRLVLEITV